jgi:hypothetical protein
MSEDNDKNSSVTKKFLLYKDIAVAFVEIGKAFIAIFTGISFVVVLSLINPQIVQLVLVIINFITLGIGCWFLRKTYTLEFRDDEGIKEYCEQVEIKPDSNCIEEAGINNDRVNKLVVQLKNWIIFYALALMIVYLIFSIDNAYWYSDDNFYSRVHRICKVPEDIFNFLSSVALYLGFKVLYNQTLKKDKENSPRIYYADAVIVSVFFVILYLVSTIVVVSRPEYSNIPRETIYEISNITANYKATAANTALNSIEQIENASNKYRRITSKKIPNSNLNVNKEIFTIDSDKKIFESNRGISNSNIKNETIDSIDEISKIAANYNSSINQQAASDMKKAIDAYEGVNKTIWLNLFSLFIGICNGLAMSLLFGRYVSMEHLVNDQKNEEFYNFFSFSIIFILPMYALAQPLFGSFEINAFGPSAVFANCVFFICWVGKAVFLGYTWKFMKDKSIHHYLHLVITSQGISDEFKKCFNPEPKGDSEIEKTD